MKTLIARAAGGWRRTSALLRRRAVRRTAAGVAVAGLAAAAWIRVGPLPAGLLDEADAVRSTTVLDRNGEVLYEARSDLGTREMRLRPDRLPASLVAATLAAEDHRFHSHWGIDPIAMARATWRNVAALDRVEGGSTLTQQVAKLLLDRRAQLAAGTPRRRGWGSKIEEAVVALRLEHRLSKADILALYLNLAPYGNQIAGAERASHAYFGSDSAMLTPAQAAFLAALPQRPSRFNPWRSLAQATARQRVVLARMERRGFLPAAAAAIARAERLRLADEDARFLAPHFVGMVLADLPDPKPTRVVTTLDAALQRTIEGIVRSQRPLLEKHGATNVAIVVLDNTTSQWLAWEGSGNYGGDRGGSINGPTALRQPGSALKPFTYALAFESGGNPATELPDIPANFPTAEDGVIYTPRNYDGRFRGPLLARAALAGSINVPAVSLASDLGVANVLRFLRRAGFTTFDKTAAHYGLGLTLGNAEVRLDELTAAYAAFARGGEWRAPRARLDPEPRLGRSGAARVAAHRLLDHGHPGRRRGARVHLRPRQPARFSVSGRGEDGHVAGVSRQLDGRLVAPRDRGRVGRQLRPIAADWLLRRDRRRPAVPRRDAGGRGSGRRRDHAERRRRAGSAVDAGRSHDLRALGHASRRCLPAAAARAARAGRRAGRRARRARGITPATAEVVTIWPERYRAWADANGLRSPVERRAEVQLARHATTTAGEPRHRPAAGLHVAHPADGTVFLIDPTLRPEFQALPFRAVGAGGGQVSWTVNGRDVGTAGADGSVLWPLQRGSHVAVVRDARGRTAQVSFVVK